MFPCSVFNSSVQTDSLNKVFTSCKLLVHSIDSHQSLELLILAIAEVQCWKSSSKSASMFQTKCPHLSRPPFSHPSQSFVNPPRLQPSRPNLSFFCECLVQLAQQKLE